MKKVCCVFFAALMLFLAACDPGLFFFDYEELVQTVDRVELISYYNPDAKEYLDIKKEKLRSFNFEKMEILQTLPEEKKEDFLFSVATETAFMVGGRVMDSPSGLCIRLVYQNGDFEILSADEEEDSAEHTYAGSFFENGEVNRFIGRILGISRLIDEYFPEYEG